MKKIGKSFIIRTSLEDLRIPANVVELKPGWCLGTNLKKVDVDEGNQIYKVFEEGFVAGKPDLNSDEYDQLIFVYKSLNDLIIPPFIRKISDSAFYDLLIHSITIPPSVTVLGSFSFYYCIVLTEVKFAENSELK